MRARPWEFCAFLALGRFREALVCDAVHTPALAGLKAFMAAYAIGSAIATISDAGGAGALAAWLRAASAAAGPGAGRLTCPSR